MAKKINKKIQRPAQMQQGQPGKESKMIPMPKYDDPNYQGSNKLLDKVAIITGGDSGIGRATAIYFAKEGADVVIAYFNEHEDADWTRKMVEENGRKCLVLAGDLKDFKFCQEVVMATIKEFKKINILINNAAEQYIHTNFEDITNEQLQHVFATNIFSYFYMTKLALPYLRKGDSIINTTSVVAYKGNYHLIDYAATKGAIVAFTRSLSQNLIKKGIRVNGVAPGPVWTPLIPASFSPKEVKYFGSQVPMERAADPREIAPCYVFLASTDASYISGQILHPNGGEIVNS